MKTNWIVKLASLLCAALVLASCSADQVSGGDVPSDDFTPVTNEGGDSELGVRYEKYRSDAELAFGSVEEADQGDFVWRDISGGVELVGYSGGEKVVRIPETANGKSVVSIGRSAFADKNMRAVYIPDSVASVEMGALEGCAGMVTLRLPCIFNDYLGYIFGADEYGENAISVPVSLDCLIVGQQVDTVPENAFSGCKTLSSVAFLAKTLSVGDFAFYECADLVYAKLGDEVAAIGEYAFFGCGNLFRIDCTGASAIGLGAFQDCRSLNSMVLSSIGTRENSHIGYIFGSENAEYGHRFVPSSLRSVTLTRHIGDVPARAFASCDHVTEVVLEEGIGSIGVRAFVGCRSLSAVSVPDSVRSIGDDAFFGCGALVEVELGEGLTHLGMQAFMNCKALKHVTLPESLEEIRPSTFYGCASLVTVDFGGVQRIGKDAFGGCQRLVPTVLGGVTVAEGNGAVKGGGSATE